MLKKLMIHAVISLVVLGLLIFFNSNLAGAITALYIVALIPLIYSFGFLNAKSKAIQKIGIPLFGAMIIPLIFYIDAALMDERYIGLLAQLLFFSNLILYVVNEIYLFSRK